MSNPRYIQALREAGQCVNGDGRAIHPGSTRYCAPCLLYMRQYQRARKGWSPRLPGACGKQPLAGVEADTGRSDLSRCGVSSVVEHGSVEPKTTVQFRHVTPLGA